MIIDNVIEDYTILLYRVLKQTQQAINEINLIYPKSIIYLIIYTVNSVNVFSKRGLLIKAGFKIISRVL